VAAADGVLLLLADGSNLPVTELPGQGPWTFLVLQPGTPDPSPPPADLDPVSAGPEPGPAARFLTRYGRAVVPELGGRPGYGEPPGAAGFLRLVDDLDQIRTRAGLGRPVLVGLGELAPVALRAGVDQPWAWRALVLARPAGSPPATGGQPDKLDLPTLALGPGPSGAAGPAGVEWAPLGPDPWAEGEGPLATAVERLLGRLGGGPGWSGIAPDAPPR
jgi:pimeloyl-ACP methyl ester carboxylesterase